MRPFVLAVLLTGLLQLDVAAQDKPDAPVRLLYSAKNMAAGDLHFVLEKHYGGVETVSFIVEKQAGVISIRAANQAALDDVLKTIATLDKTPRSIAFQGLVIDAAAPAEGAPAVELDQTQLTGPADAVRKVAGGWVKEGKAARVRIFKWTGQENQVSEDSIGELAPRVSGASSNIRGEMVPFYADMPVGTLFSVKPRITEANEIVCDLIYNHSEIDPKASLERKANGAIEPARVLQGRAQTTINIPSGRSVVVSAREGGTGGPASLVVVSATVVNPNAAPATAPAPVSAPAAAPAAAVATPAAGGLSGLRFSTSGSSYSLLSLSRTEEFTKVITLTEEQKRKLDELIAERDKVANEMNEKFRERGAAAMREEMQAYSAKRLEIDERALTVLTPEQKKAFDTFAEEYRRTARDRVRDRALAGPGEFGGFAGVTAPRDRLASVNRSLERAPNDPRFLVLRGQIYASEEKWDEAIADYRKAMEVDPRNLGAVMDLTAIFALRGDEAAYRQLAEQMLERFGEGSAAEKLRVADACLLRAEWLPNAAVAEAMLEKAIEGIPAEGARPLARNAELIQGFVGATPSTSTAQDLLVAKARLHILRSQPDEAIKVVKPLLDEAQATGRRSRPDIEISAWCSTAIAQLSKGDKDAATAAITQARRLQSEGNWPRSVTSAYSSLELTSKVRLQRAEQILGEAGVKPAAAK